MNRIFLFAILLALWSCGVDAQSEQQSTTQPTPAAAPTAQPAEQNVISASRKRSEHEINATYPFDIPLQDHEGNLYTSDQVLPKNGKPTIVLFWLTTCVPCGMEMDAIQKKYADWQEEADFNMVAISTDFPHRYDAFVNRVTKRNFPWTTLHDKDREFRKVLPGGLNGLPQTFVFDKNGQIVYHKKRYQAGDEDRLFAKVKEVL